MSDLDVALAAEEHRQGLPHIAGDHCDQCREVDRAWAEAAVRDNVRRFINAWVEAYG